MNRKEIEKDLKEKHALFAKLVLASHKKYHKEEGKNPLDQLLEYTPVELTKKVILSNTYLAGGCTASQLLGEEVKYYEFFLRDDGNEWMSIMRFFGNVQDVKRSAKATTLQVTAGHMSPLEN